MPLLDVALSCARRGWYVFPCWPKTKKPMTSHGWHDATLQEEQIRHWWTHQPEANVAIACGPSNLAVLDIDHGLGNCASDMPGMYPLEALLARGFPYSYMVRTGRRPELGLQIYYEGAIPDIGIWKHDGLEGQVKSLGGYVMAAGSVHPDSGKTYRVELDRTLAETPGLVRGLKPERVKVEDGPITGNRNVALTSIAGKLRNAGLSAAALEVSLLQVNADRCAPPLDEEEVRRIAANASKWALPDMAAVATVGKPKPSTSAADSAKPVEYASEWRSHFHSKFELENTPPPQFLIKDFLLADSITALAAPVAQRKSLVALNIAHALCTGEKLFGYFDVARKPTRVLYIVPEMGIRSFGARVRSIGLTEYADDTFFCRTMNADRDGVLPLEALGGEEVEGAVVIIDTIVRYLEGAEDASSDMRLFARTIFALKTRIGVDGALVLLHHSSKSTKETAELTLENCLRGSGEIGAFVTSCWATRLIDSDPAKSHTTPSYLTNVKQRDFISEPFTALCNKDCRMTIDTPPGPGVKLQDRSKNRDGKEDEAIEIIRELDEKGASLSEMVSALETVGIRRKKSWVSTKRAQIRGNRR